MAQFDPFPQPCDPNLGRDHGDDGCGGGCGARFVVAGSADLFGLGEEVAGVDLVSLVGRTVQV